MPNIKNFLLNIKPTKAESHSENLFNDMQNLWFESDVFDAKIVALYWLERQNVDFLLKNKKNILGWIEQIDNWAHSDLYCCILARMFDKSQKSLLTTYKKWNKHKNPWHRRCSMVGTFYYSQLRTNQPSLALAKQLVTPHLTAKEYYVQKGVGWTIREMYNVYPEQTVNYIQINLKNISSVAWVAASEKLPKNIKTKLLKTRKINRKKD